MYKKSLIIFSFCLILNCNLTLSSQAYENEYQNINSTGSLAPINNSYWTHNGYSTSLEISKARNADIENAYGTSQAHQQLEMKQWLNEHPGQREQMQQVFQAH